MLPGRVSKEGGQVEVEEICGRRNRPVARRGYGGLLRSRPVSWRCVPKIFDQQRRHRGFAMPDTICTAFPSLESCRSEEHTSELQSRRDLVCRLLLEKKKKK